MTRGRRSRDPRKGSEITRGECVTDIQGEDLRGTEGKDGNRSSRVGKRDREDPMTPSPWREGVMAWTLIM